MWHAFGTVLVIRVDSDDDCKGCTHVIDAEETRGTERSREQANKHGKHEYEERYVFRLKCACVRACT